jgi:hypothetical protein
VVELLRAAGAVCLAVFAVAAAAALGLLVWHYVIKKIG